MRVKGIKWWLIFDPDHKQHAKSVFFHSCCQTHLSLKDIQQYCTLEPESSSTGFHSKEGKQTQERAIKVFEVVLSDRRTHPPTVSHHGRHLVLAEQFLCHVLHMLQGLLSGQRAAVFNPSTGFSQGGQELEGTTPLLICGIKGNI